MHNQSGGSLLTSLKQDTRSKIIPVIEQKAQFSRVFDLPAARPILLRHCNLFELSGFLERARQQHLPVYVYIDQIDGIHADNAGIRYLSERMGITGIISNHPRVLAIGKEYGLETIQRMYVLDSTGLDAALEALDTSIIDLLDISPALVVPHVIPRLRTPLPLPFLASGLLLEAQHVRSVLQHGASGVFVARDDLWSVA
jgi:glycerol uptake operon antiterminator